MGLYDILVIVCFVVGIGMAVVEACMPGFGVAGITGIALCIATVIFADMGHGPTFALCVTGIVVVLLAFLIWMLLRSLKKGKLSRKIVLNECENAEEGTPEAYLPQVGEEGSAVTALRPEGEADFGGNRCEVTCEDGFAARDSKIRVTGIAGKKVLVKALKLEN